VKTCEDCGQPETWDHDCGYVNRDELWRRLAIAVDALEQVEVYHNGEKACGFLCSDPMPCACHVGIAREALAKIRSTP
jgi:hypothetical protein